MARIQKYLFFDGLCQINGIEICDAGYEYCVPCHKFGPYVRDYYMIHFVENGKGTFIRNKRYEINRHQAFLIRPGELTTYAADAERPWYYLWLGFRGEAVKEIVDKAVGEECVFDVSDDIMYELEALYKTYADNTEFVLKAISILYRFLGNAYATISKLKRQYKPDIIRSAVNFIESNYCRPFDMSVLSRELGISRAYFTMLFTQAMHISPYKYLINFRIAKAQKLLEDSPILSVSDIAYAVGFSSVERFSEIFRKYSGLSPAAWRKEKRKTETSAKK